MIKETESRYRYFLVFMEDDDKMPQLYGFSSQESRDDTFDMFLLDGFIELNDPITGASREIHPILVARMDLIDGKWYYIDKKGEDKNV